MKKNLILLAGIIFLASACSFYNINSEEVTSKFYPPKESSDQVAYLDNVTQAHEIIGFVTVNAERHQSMDEITEKMKHEAAMLGGDAITNITTDASGAWKKVPPQKLLGNAYVRANFTATVVAFQ